MKEKIVEQIVKARQEAIMWANHEIKAIAVKYQGRKDKKELLEAELLKAREFQDSAVGNGYINSLAPGFKDDEELIETIANYYVSSKVVASFDFREWTEEFRMDYVHDDSLKFLQRYYLSRYLSQMLYPSVPEFILEYFQNEQLARKWLDHLNPESDAVDVVYWFRHYSDYKNPSDRGHTSYEFHKFLFPRWCGQSGKNLQKTFDGINPSKKAKRMLE